MTGVIWFNDVKENDYNSIGEKAFSLSELHKAGFSVPNGFILNSQLFNNFLNENGISNAIKNLLKTIDLNDSESLRMKASEIRDMILSAGISNSLSKEIVENYSNLNVHLDIFKIINSNALNMITSGRDLPYVAVRTSLVGDDKDMKHSTLLNIRGNSNVLKAIKQCWASLYSPENIMSRAEKGLNVMDIGCSLIIQKQINSEKSGVIFTSPEEDLMIIEAGFGLGESVINQEINPDVYKISKSNLEVKDMNINHKPWMYTRDETAGVVKKMNLENSKAVSRVLSQNEIMNLAKLGMGLEQSYGAPRDVEFALENGKTYVIQTRKMFNLKKPFKKEAVEEKEEVKEPENSSELFSFLDNPVEEHKDEIEEKPFEAIKQIEKGEVVTLNFHDIKIDLPKDLKSIQKARRLLDMLEEDLR